MKSSTTPTNKFNLITKAGHGTMRQFRRPREGALQRPQMALAFQDASWWVLAELDSALVSAAEGTSAAWYKRDPQLFRSLGWRSLVAASCGYRLQWPQLAAQYRARQLLTSTRRSRWRETFAASLNPPPDTAGTSARQDAGPRDGAPSRAHLRRSAKRLGG